MISSKRLRTELTGAWISFKTTETLTEGLTGTEKTREVDSDEVAGGSVGRRKEADELVIMELVD